MSGGKREATTGSTFQGPTSTETKPWATAAPYAEAALIAAGGTGSAEDIAGNLGFGGPILSTPLEYFPGSTVVDFAPETLQAYEGITQRAGGDQALYQGAEQQYLDTLGGSFLNREGLPDPFQDALTASVMPAVSSQFGRAGRQFSPGHAEAAARGMSRGAAQYIVPQYEAERNRMMQAAAGAPGLERSQYLPYEMLAQVGGAREALDQAQLSEEIERFQFGQAEPYQRLEALMGVAYPATGFGGTAAHSAVQGETIARGPRPGIGAAMLNSSFGAFNSGKVICTELVRQGLISDSVRRVGAIYHAKMGSDRIMRGYHAWAVPAVRLIRRRKGLARAMVPIAKGRARYMRHRLAGRKPPLWACLCNALVEWPSWVIGGFVKQNVDYTVLYGKEA